MSIGRSNDHITELLPTLTVEAGINKVLVTSILELYFIDLANDGFN